MNKKIIFLFIFVVLCNNMKFSQKKKKTTHKTEINQLMSKLTKLMKKKHINNQLNFLNNLEEVSRKTKNCLKTTNEENCEIKKLVKTVKKMLDNHQYEEACKMINEDKSPFSFRPDLKFKALYDLIMYEEKHDKPENALENINLIRKKLGKNKACCSFHLAKIYYIAGKIYKSKKQYRKSALNFYKAQKIYTRLDDKAEDIAADIISCYFEIGNYYMCEYKKNKGCKKAYSYYEKILSHPDIDDSMFTHAKIATLINISLVEKEKNFLNKIKYCNEAIKIANKNRNKMEAVNEGITDSLISKAIENKMDALEDSKLLSLKNNFNYHSHFYQTKSQVNMLKKCCNLCEKKTDTRCSRCTSVYYCSPNCQKKDWPEHKYFCYRKDKTREPILSSSFH